MSLPSLQDLDKSTWQKLPFGEIAKSIGERVDPTKTDLETYVGLEHIDAESIHIKRFGKREDVSGTKLRCYPGDVIFGRRRAYQRKAAICEFDGFCSAHSLVLRAIPEAIDPKLFPFFLHSNQFMHRAVDISVGGLSPTINWTKLKKEKFMIPPKDQQAKLAELLWAADAVLEAQARQIESLATTISTCLKEEYTADSDVVCRLGDAGKWMSGGTPSRRNSKFWNGEIPWVSPKDMKVERISDSIEKITEAAIESRISTLPVHSILIVVRGLILNHSFPVAITEAPVAFNQDMKALVTSDRFDPFYVLYFLQHMKEVVLGMTTTTTHGTKRLASDAIFGLSVPCPPISKQKAFTKKVETMKVGALRAQQNRQSTHQLFKSLINQIF